MKYEAQIDIEELIILLETPENKFQAKINTIDEKWLPISNHEPGFAYSNGTHIIMKPSKDRLLFVDQSSDSKDFHSYIKSISTDRVQEDGMSYFTYKKKYLVQLNDLEYPADVSISKVFD